MRFPTIKQVAEELRGINANVEGECDVRLCVWEGGEWCVKCGDVSYDTEHAPMCGAASVPGVVAGRVSRFSARDLARDLIEQVREQHAQDAA